MDFFRRLLLGGTLAAFVLLAVLFVIGVLAWDDIEFDGDLKTLTQTEPDLGRSMRISG